MPLMAIRTSFKCRLEYKVMKRLACAAIAATVSVAGLAPSYAADLPQAAPTYDTTYEPAPSGRFDWSGAYAGGSLGWVWSGFDTTSSPTGSFDHDTNGFSGGVHGGYNFAITPNIVAGVELDFQMTDLYENTVRNGVNVKTSSAWNSSARARLGYAMDRFLVYGTAGLAIADLSINANGASEDTTALGWTAGAGVEGAISNNLTARVEYLYQDFGRESFTLGGSKYRADLDTSTVRFGLSYKF
ncbi:22 kDa outer membrane protein [Roseibium sp. TrichSKD4]|nr:22 kDa outer membrane protein [Roseibium sp. TrichSKD4]